MKDEQDSEQARENAEWRARESAKPRCSHGNNAKLCVQSHAARPSQRLKKEARALGFKPSTSRKVSQVDAAPTIARFDAAGVDAQRETAQRLASEIFASGAVLAPPIALEGVKASPFASMRAKGRASRASDPSAPWVGSPPLRR